MPVTVNLVIKNSMPVTVNLVINNEAGHSNSVEGAVGEINGAKRMTSINCCMTGLEKQY